jgi:hypothetical protein
MSEPGNRDGRAPAVLDVVALRTDVPEQRLTRGSVGTIVDEIDDEVVLVEFSDDDGRPYAVAACQRSDLLTLH